MAAVQHKDHKGIIMLIAAGKLLDRQRRNVSDSTLVLSSSLDSKGSVGYRDARLGQEPTRDGVSIQQADAGSGSDACSNTPPRAEWLESWLLKLGDSPLGAPNVDQTDLLWLQVQDADDLRKGTPPSTLKRKRVSKEDGRPLVASRRDWNDHPIPKHPAPSC
jgi:hypothetical protein